MIGFNRRKIETTGPFFNPRTDNWFEHFRLSEGLIEPLTEIGEVTIKVLGFNDLERILERKGLIEIGCYPPESVRKKY